MLETGGLGRLALRRIRADWAVASLAWLLLVAGAALPATGILYGERVALGSLRARFVTAPAGDRTVRAAISAPLDEIDGVDAVMASEVGRSIAPAAPGGDAASSPIGGSGPAPGVVRVLRSDGFTLASPAGVAGDLVVFGAFDDISSHASLTDGRWAQPGRTPLEATLSEGAATALGLGVGDTAILRDIRDATHAVTLRVIGTWRPDASDAYWVDDTLDLTGSETIRRTTRGPFVVARDDLRAAAASRDVGAEWRGLPSADRLTLRTSALLRAGLELLPRRLQAAVGVSRSVAVTTGLPDLLADLEQAALVGRELIVLLVAQLAVLAGYALVLVGSVLAGRRREENALLRERGAGAGQVAAAAIMEGLVLGAPAAVAATLIAGVGVGILASGSVAAAAGVVGGPDALTLLVACVGVGLGALALVAPTLTAGTNLPALRAALGRRMGQTLAQRLGLDLVLFAVAAVAIWQVRSYSVSASGGGPDGGPVGAGQSLDPVLVLTPAIGLLAGAVLVMRLVPRLAEIAERRLGGLRGPVLPMAGREVARRPQRHTRVALLVVLAAALGGLASAHAATWVRSQADQAAYQVVADVRVISAPAAGSPGWLAGPAYRALPGVAAATAVLHRNIETGPAAGGQLLALDAAAVAGLSDLPASAAAVLPMLGDLSSGRPAAQVAALPPGTRRLEITVDADLRVSSDQPGAPPANPEIPGVGVTVYLADADGRIITLDAGTAPATAAGSRLEVQLARAIGGQPVAPDDGLGVLAVELSLAPPAGGATTGTVELRGLAASASDAPAAGPWTDVALDPDVTGWGWLRLDAGRQVEYRPPGARWSRITIGTGPGATHPVGGPGSAFPTRFRLWTAPESATPLPAIANSAFLQQMGAKVGDRVDGQMVGDGVGLRIVGVTDLFPPLDPGRPFVVVDRSWFERARLGAGGGTVDVDEWWLATSAAGQAGPGAGTALGDALRGPPFQAREVMGRAAVREARLVDPIGLGIIGALRLGALAAVVFATIGFVFQAAVSTRERLAEFALLRALGVSGNQVLQWLWLEHASVLAFSLGAGTGLGLLLAWLLVPSATLTATGAAPVPAPEIVVPLSFIAGLAIAAAFLLVLTLGVLARLVRRIEVAATLREGQT